jgi:hypothetical protein
MDVWEERVKRMGIFYFYSVRNWAIVRVGSIEEIREMVCDMVH